MIKVFCSKCKKELTEPGGLLFGPPFINSTIKYHICVSCMDLLIDKFKICNCIVGGPICPICRPDLFKTVDDYK